MSRFLEYGEDNGHMYGTSLDSVKDVLDNGKICVIDLEPNVSHLFIETKLMVLSLIRLQTVMHMHVSVYSSALIQSEPSS